MLHLPKQVGQPYQDGNSYPDPEPFALQVAPRVREKQGRDDAQHEETDGVLRKHAEADTDADAYPPSRVAGYKQPNDKVRRRDPGQAIERPRTASRIHRPGRNGTAATAAIS